MLIQRISIYRSLSGSLWNLFWSSPEDLESIDKRINAPTKWKNCLIDLNQEIGEQSRETGRKISELILNWIIWHKDVASILVGTNNVEHLKQNVSVFGQLASQSEVKQTDDIIKCHYEKRQLDFL